MKAPFSAFSDQIQKQFDAIIDNQQFIFIAEVEEEKIWELYLEGFDNPLIRQDNNCSRCKSFLAKYAGIGTLKDYKFQSIWDMPEELLPAAFRPSVKASRTYVHSLPISDVLLVEKQSLGRAKNYCAKHDVYYGHIHLKLPEELQLFRVINQSFDIEELQSERQQKTPRIYWMTEGESVTAKRAELLTSKKMLTRALNEIQLFAIETVLELIGQNSLYRGKEFEEIVRAFYELAKAYSKVEDTLKDNFCWLKSLEILPVISRIRNKAIGTLLVNLSKEMFLDDAVAKFEKIVAPANYQRPSSLISPQMVEEAKAKLAKHNLLASVYRRFATDADISIKNVLYVDRSSELFDIFDQMQKDHLITPRSLSKVEEVGIEDFIENVLPNVKSLEILMENRHVENLFSLITAQEEDAKSLFKWKNNFSWSYSGGITDSIKERVEAQGGNTDGVLRVSLSWFNYDDLDIQVIEPHGHKIYFLERESETSGKLDVDMNYPKGTSRNAVENIIWDDVSKMREGTYQVIVTNYAPREEIDNGFEVQIEYGGEVFDFGSKKSPAKEEEICIVQFEYSKKQGIRFKNNIKTSLLSKEKWGISSNKFVKVKKMMLSPNYWDSEIGNKHYLFMLEDCISDESPRPFFNEFINNELSKHRKVLEVMANKLKVAPSTNQMSGLGFSETIRNHVIVKAEGAFKRHLKIIF